MYLGSFIGNLSERAKLFLLAFACFVVALLLSLLIGGWWATSVVVIPGLLGFLQITKGVWAAEGGGKSKIGLASLGVALAAVVSSEVWRPALNALLGPIYEAVPQLKDKLPHDAPSIIALLFLAVVILVVNYFARDTTAMKEHPTPIEEEFPENGYKHVLNSFCGVLLDDLNKIDRETNWSSEVFTPLDAEVEIKSGSRRLKKVTDLLKAIRSDRRSRVFLVLGDPGSGKSVALRKLCRDLLSEVKITGRVPLYINLREWESKESWSKDSPPTVERLYRFVLQNLKSRGDVFANEFLDKYFKKMFENGRLFFVLDSFDEIPAVMDVNESSWLIDCLSEVIHKFLAGAHESRGILASRMFRRPTAKFDAQTVLEVRPFTELQIVDFLKKSLFYDESLVTSLFTERPELVPIARNPFTAALISSYAKDHDNKLPKNQEELYSSYITRRLDACIDRITESQLTKERIFKAAVEIADVMLTTETFGLEASLSSLREKIPDERTDDVVAILKYARLGRLGSTDDQRFSFVHRRFNEYFVVQRLKEQPERVPHDAIPTDSRWRDALVLYCEVAGETEATSIAEYCWSEISAIRDSSLDMGAPEYLRAVHCLRFLKEAFRARMACINSFRGDLADFIIERIQGDNLLLQKLAVEAVGLLDPIDIDRALMSALELNNQWISETALKSCHYLPRLSRELNARLRLAIESIDVLVFLKRRREIMFSVRLSNVFTDLKRFCIWRTIDFYLFALGMVIALVAFPPLALAALLMGTGVIAFFWLMLQGRWPTKAALAVIFTVVMAKRFMIATSLIYVVSFSSLFTRSVKGLSFGAYAYFPRYAHVTAIIILLVIPWYQLFYFFLRFLPSTRMKHVAVVLGIIAAYAGFGGLAFLLIKLLSLFVPAIVGTILLKVLFAAMLLSGLFVVFRQLFFLVFDFRIIRGLPRRAVITRQQIAQEFSKLKTGRGRLAYVRHLQNVQTKPQGSWREHMPNAYNDAASTLLAQLEEKWLGLDR